MSAPEPDDWTAVGEDRVVHEGFVRILSRRMRLPDGREVDWELSDVPPTVAVLAFTPERQIVMVRQFRPGAGRLVTSLPGGLVDPGEDPVVAAARELREETGYAGSSVRVVATVHPHSATHPRYTAVAEDCVPVGDQQLDEFEDVAVVVMSLTQVRRDLRAGLLGATEQTYLALDHLGLL